VRDECGPRVQRIVEFDSKVKVLPWWRHSLLPW